MNVLRLTVERNDHIRFAIRFYIRFRFQNIRFFHDGKIRLFQQIGNVIGKNLLFLFRGKLFVFVHAVLTDFNIGAQRRVVYFCADFSFQKRNRVFPQSVFSFRRQRLFRRFGTDVHHRFNGGGGGLRAGFFSNFRRCFRAALDQQFAVGVAQRGQILFGDFRHEPFLDGFQVFLFGDAPRLAGGFDGGQTLEQSVRGSDEVPLYQQIVQFGVLEHPDADVENKLVSTLHPEWNEITFSSFCAFA